MAKKGLPIGSIGEGVEVMEMENDSHSGKQFGSFL